MCFCGKALPFNKVGCTREYKTKLRICFDIPLICTTFAAVECVFAYRCLFPYLQHICSTLTQMACLITVCISRRLSKFDKQVINKENPCSSLSYTDFFCRLCLIWIIKDIDQVVYFLFIQKIILHLLLPDLNGIQRQVLMQGCCIPQTYREVCLSWSLYYCLSIHTSLEQVLVSSLLV